MATWGQLADARPDLAEAGRALLYQHGVGLAFLATVRADGGPRLHPMCPLLTDDGLFAFIVPSLKCQDLHRDGRYAMHSFPCPDDEDALWLTGRAKAVDDVALRRSLVAQFEAERAQHAVEVADDQDLFTFDVERCLHTTTTGHGDPAPHHTVWHAG